MFETAEERVKLLKKGLSGKEIEALYIEHNNFKLIRKPILYEAKDFDRARSNLDNNIPIYYKKKNSHVSFLRNIRIRAGRTFNIIYSYSF
ncbi:MAG: hypothetical protein A2W22_01665 [Candidatus Levybacteria bacterium RBG_16_35_11]|nr:MAG: hypothetical protein A2W22_01665 [Candidatus Levybacteria bacterium RBG_16_35_11]